MEKTADIKNNMTVNIFCIIGVSLIIAKLRIFSGISKEYFKVVHAEDTAVAYLAALAGGKLLNAARASKPGSVSTELKLRSEKEKSITC